jgi:hypothetical protein
MFNAWISGKCFVSFNWFNIAGVLKIWFRDCRWIVGV